MNKDLLMGSLLICTLLAFVLVIISIWKDGKRKQRKHDEAKKRHAEGITDIFVKIGDQFSHHGLIFEHKFKGGEHSGRTLRNDPGVVINFEPFINDSYRIKLQRDDSDDNISLDIRRARDIIHREIVAPLASLSRNSRCLSIRRNIFELKKVGIEQVVTELVGLQREYDEIWFDLEACRIPERMSEFLKLYDEEYDRYMQAIDLVINRHFPVENKETKTAS